MRAPVAGGIDTRHVAYLSHKRQLDNPHTADYVVEAMVRSPQHDDSEIAAIAASTAALSKLTDADARRRVLSYVLARYLPESPLRPFSRSGGFTTATHGLGSPKNGELYAAETTCL